MKSQNGAGSKQNLHMRFPGDGTTAALGSVALLEGMLRFVPAQRLTIADALESPFLQHPCSDSGQVNEEAQRSQPGTVSGSELCPSQSRGSSSGDDGGSARLPAGRAGTADNGISITGSSSSKGAITVAEGVAQWVHAHRFTGTPTSSGGSASQKRQRSSSPVLTHIYLLCSLRDY